MAHQPAIRVDVDLVLLEAHVTDQKGQPVYSLEADDFRVYEDGVLQKVAFFSAERDQPISLAILLDNSRGMTEMPLREGKAAVRQLIHLLRPEDEILLATYHKDFYLEQDFTTDRPELIEALDNIYPRAPSRKGLNTLGTLFGSEPAYTGLGVDLALIKLRERKHTRKVLLVISNRYTGMGPATTDHIRAAEIPMFALSFKNSGWAIMSLGGDKMALQNSVGESGGLIYKAEAQDLQHTLRTLADGFKNFYHIGYYPPEKTKDRKLRKIKVETSDKSFVVHTRRSYVPPAKNH